jgi:putative ABC transport system permease protein
MITAVASLGISFMDLMRRQAIATDGEWHVLYHNVNEQQLQRIKKDEDTKTTILSREVGYAYLHGSKNKNKPYLYLKEFNQEGYENFPMELQEGRWPQKENEIIISEEIINNGKVKLKIGDSLTLTTGKRFSLEKEEGTEEQLPMDQTRPLSIIDDAVQEYLTEERTQDYTIVGIMKRPEWEYTWSPGYTVISYVNESMIIGPETVDASVIVKKVDQSIFEHAEKMFTSEDVLIGFNNYLLRYYGVVKDDSLRSILYTLSGIMIGIIMIGSISLIYNAFAISVAERSRYLGMLSSVGATKKQKRNSVFYEGAVIGVISIPIGIVAGFTGIGITFLCINPMVKSALEVVKGFRLVIEPTSIVLAVLVSVATIFISSYLPAKKASNISAIDAIRQTTEVRITKKTIKTMKLTRKLFGMEGDLGLKNLKRNRGRYKATVFSLIISILLFLVVSFFTDGLKKSMSMTQDGINFDMQISLSGEPSQKEAVYRKIIAMKDITKYVKYDRMEVTTYVPKEKTPEFVKGFTALENGTYLYHVILCAMDDQSLKSYAQEVGADIHRLQDTKQPSAILIDKIKYKDMNEDKYYEDKPVMTKIGDEFALAYYDYETNHSIPLTNIKVAALTDVYPMGVLNSGYNAQLSMIVSQEVFDRIVNSEDLLAETIGSYLYVNSDDPLQTQESIENLPESNDLYVYNVYRYRQSEQQMILLMSVFTYAFILLITSICIANIMNTISTSIALRKREFAMLKSVGITPKGFNKMLHFESIFYGLKALFYGLPISFAVMYLLHITYMKKFEYDFTIPWMNILIVIVSVFGIVSISMLYSSKKVKRENIIDALKQEID